MIEDAPHLQFHWNYAHSIHFCKMKKSGRKCAQPHEVRY